MYEFEKGVQDIRYCSVQEQAKEVQSCCYAQVREKHDNFKVMHAEGRESKLTA